MRTGRIKNNIFAIAVFSIALMLSIRQAHAGLDKRHNEPGLVYRHGDITQPKIALTFDDGPNEPYTSEILDILKKYNVKATFFVLGKNVERYPDIAKRIVKEGHSIGNHTYDHPYLLVQSKSHIEYQLRKTEQAIVTATGIKPRLFRPPYGVNSSWIYNILKENGYVTVEWSVTGHNGGRDIPPEKIIGNVLNKAKNGSIILLHDGDRLIRGADRRNIVRALPVIIESLQKDGYRLVTVPELLSLDKGAPDK